MQMTKRFGCRYASSQLFIAVALVVITGCGSENGEGTPSSATGGSSSSATGGSSSSATGGSSSSATGGSSSSATGGSSSSAATDVAEKGLGAISIDCTDPIVDGTPVICALAVQDSEGALSYSDQAAIKIRGRSSSNFPKKNYAVELRDASGLDNPSSLLGMGKDADWVLDGAWVDRSFMRNRLTYSLFRDTDPARWAPRARYCELTLNGEDAGIYVLLEKIKRDDDRLNLPDDDGTGNTFIVKQDDQGTLSLSIGSANKWQLVYPNENVATPVQRKAVQLWLDSLGAALRSTNPSDLLKLVEPAALVDFILVEEFSKNIDAYNLSLHVVRSGGGLAWFVPWDIDLAYGQPTLKTGTNESSSGWISSRTTLIQKLSAVPSIRTALGPRWRQLRTGIFSNAAITERLDRYASILNDAAIARNFDIWPIAAVDFAPIYDPYSLYKVASYADELSHFRGWVAQRLVWLDANIDSYPAR